MFFKEAVFQLSWHTVKTSASPCQFGRAHTHACGLSFGGEECFQNDIVTTRGRRKTIYMFSCIQIAVGKPAKSKVKRAETIFSKANLTDKNQSLFLWRETLGFNGWPDADTEQRLTIVLEVEKNE